MFGEVLHDAGEEALGGLLGAEQDEVDVLIPAKKQTFGQDSNPHHSLQGSGTVTQRKTEKKEATVEK